MSSPSSDPVVATIAGTTNVSMSLVDGLRSAAMLQPNRRLSRRYGQLAERIARGETLDDAWRNVHAKDSAYIGGILKLGIQSGRLPEVLTDMAVTESERHKYFIDLWSILIYPAFISLLAVVVSIICIVSVVPAIAAMIREYGVQVSERWESLAWSIDSGWKYLAAFTAIVVCVVLAIRIIFGRAVFRSLVDRVPVIGPIVMGQDLLLFLHQLHKLVSLHLPTGESLRLLSAATRNSSLAAASARSATAVDAGKPLASAMQETGTFPPLITHIISWGEQNNRLADSLMIAHKIVTGQTHCRLKSLQIIAPSIAFLFVVSLISCLVSLVFEGLVPLMSMLGGGVGGIAPAAGGSSISAHHLIGLAFIGGALLWCAGHTSRRHGGNNLLLTTLVITGWVLVCLGVISFLYGLGSFYILPFVLIIGLMTVFQYREGERQQIGWLVQTVLDHGLALPPALRAFVVGRADDMSHRTLRLAELVDSGMTLSDALKKSRVPLPTHAALAVRMAGGVNGRGDVPAESSELDVALAKDLGTACAQLLYASASITVQALVFTFIAVQIAPVIQRLSNDLLGQPSYSWNLPFSAMNSAIPLHVYLYPVVCIAGGLGLLVLIYMIGWIRYEPAIASPLTIMFHRSLILRSISQHMRHGYSLPYTLAQLEIHYPVGWVRRRLRLINHEVRSGANWPDAFGGHGLISRIDREVLSAAQRVGNVAWAANELADRASRLLIFRIRATMRVLYPSIVLLAALPIACLSISVFSILAEYIQALS